MAADNTAKRTQRRFDPILQSLTGITDPAARLQVRYDACAGLARTRRSRAHERVATESGENLAEGQVITCVLGIMRSDSA